MLCIESIEKLPNSVLLSETYLMPLHTATFAFYNNGCCLKEIILVYLDTTTAWANLTLFIRSIKIRFKFFHM